MDVCRDISIGSGRPESPRRSAVPPRSSLVVRTSSIHHARHSGGDDKSVIAARASPPPVVPESRRLSPSPAVTAREAGVYTADRPRQIFFFLLSQPPPPFTRALCGVYATGRPPERKRTVCNRYIIILLRNARGPPPKPAVNFNVNNAYGVARCVVCVFECPAASAVYARITRIVIIVRIRRRRRRRSRPRPAGPLGARPAHAVIRYLSRVTAITQLHNSDDAATVTRAREVSQENRFFFFFYCFPGRTPTTF